MPAGMQACTAPHLSQAVALLQHGQQLVGNTHEEVMRTPTRPASSIPPEASFTRAWGEGQVAV
jgi:hypothetical protein